MTDWKTIMPSKKELAIRSVEVAEMEIKWLEGELTIHRFNLAAADEELRTIAEQEELES